MYNYLPDFVEAVKLAHLWCTWDSSGYLILHHARNWVKIPLLRLYIFQGRELLLLVSSPGYSRVPGRSAVGVTLISGLQDHASAWSFGDLLFLIPESIREIHGHHPQCLGTGNGASPGWGSGDMNSSVLECWNAAGDKQQNGKESDGSKIPAAIRAANRDRMKGDSSLGRESEAKGPCKIHSAEDLAENLNCQLVMPKV